MKPVQNPTTYFFKQAQNPTTQYDKEIETFVSKLLNKKTCLLCQEDYNLNQKVPRILIHCGHTFCNNCLLHFFLNRRVRCPMCLKLVKHLDNLERLPINHTIFTQLVQKEIQRCESLGIQPAIKDASKWLFVEFERVQKQAHMQQNPQKIDPDSGLPYCTFHGDRVQHFYCSSHKTGGCRVCIEIGHNKPDCSVLDVYEINDPDMYAKMQAAIFGKDKEQQNQGQASSLFENGDMFLGAEKFKDTFNMDKDDDDDDDDDEDFEDEEKLSNNSI